MVKIMAAQRADELFNDSDLAADPLGGRGARAGEADRGRAHKLNGDGVEGDGENSDGKNSGPVRGSI